MQFDLQFNRKQQLAFIDYFESIKLFTNVVRNILYTHYELCMDQDQLLMCSITELQKRHNEIKKLINKAFDVLIINLQSNPIEYREKKLDERNRSVKHIPAEKEAFLSIWLLKNLKTPYPDESELSRLSEYLDMNKTTIKNYFSNERKRELKPLLKQFNQ